MTLCSWNPKVSSQLLTSGREEKHKSDYPISQAGLPRRMAQRRTQWCLAPERSGQNDEGLLCVKSTNLNGPWKNQSWAFHLQPQPNSAPFQLWSRSVGCDQMARFKANSTSALRQQEPGTALRWYTNGGWDAPAEWEALNISATILLFLRGLKGIAGRRLSLEVCDLEYQDIQDKQHGHLAGAAHGRGSGRILCLFHGISTSVLSFLAFFIRRCVVWVLNQCKVTCHLLQWHLKSASTLPARYFIVKISVQDYFAWVLFTNPLE